MNEQWTELDRRLLALAYHGARCCGSGFGKYPLGIQAALKELAPLTTQLTVQEAIAALDKRLADD